MAYTNAIFYLDFVNGNDAARTALTGCIASNPSGTITRINKTAHGLVTGAVVDLTLFSTWLNGAWKITKVDNDNFDLDTAVWQTTADNNGTVTPRGGSSWSDAWLTINNGATASRTAAGDTMRVAKSPDPTSIGNATWTNKSATVTLATAQTATIDNCETAWTAANGSTVTRITTRFKQGSYAAQIGGPTTVVASTKYAYFTLPATLDLSAYQEITFWFYNGGSGFAANSYQIKLCSDTTGDTAVDTFNIPAIASNSAWVPLAISRNGGGNLGNSISSIAFYSNTNLVNSFVVNLDNFSACTTNGLNLTTLISKNSSAYTNPATSDTWHGLQSINGTTVVLGNVNSFNADNTGLKGYWTSGTSPATVTTYIRPTIKFATAASDPVVAQPIQRSGTAGNLITYSGGWDTSSNTQNGDTWIDGQNGRGVGISMNIHSYIKHERINACRFYQGYGPASSTVYPGWDVTGVTINCSLDGFGIGANNSTYLVMTNNNTNAIRVYGSSPRAYANIATVYSYNNNNYTQQHTGYGNYYPSIIHCNSAPISNNFQDGGIGIADYIFQDSNTGNNGLFSSVKILVNDLIINNSTATNGGYITNLGGEPIYITKLSGTGNTVTNTTGVTGRLSIQQTNISGSLYVNYATDSGLIQPCTFFNLINNDPNDNRAYWQWGNALSQTTTRHTASGIAWQINITNTGQTSTVPAVFPIAKVACNANSLVTVKAWIKLSHATDIGAKLYIKGNQLPGINADITATKSADTNWEELTVTFTPTVKGVVEVAVEAYWLANLADESVYVDDVTITQA